MAAVEAIAQAAGEGEDDNDIRRAQKEQTPVQPGYIVTMVPSTADGTDAAIVDQSRTGRERS